MKKISQTITQLLCFLLLIGCSNEQKTVKNNVSPHVEETVTISGEDVFVQSCIACHSSGKLVGGAYKLETGKLQKDFKEKEKLHNFIVRNMPEDAPGSLSQEEYEAIVEYLWTQK